jgi:hypothetical protein
MTAWASQRFAGMAPVSCAMCPTSRLPDVKVAKAPLPKLIRHDGREGALDRIAPYAARDRRISRITAPRAPVSAGVDSHAHVARPTAVVLNCIHRNCAQAAPSLCVWQPAVDWSGRVHRRHAVPASMRDIGTAQSSQTLAGHRGVHSPSVTPARLRGTAQRTRSLEARRQRRQVGGVTGTGRRIRTLGALQEGSRDAARQTRATPCLLPFPRYVAPYCATEAEADAAKSAARTRERVWIDIGQGTSAGCEERCTRCLHWNLRSPPFPSACRRVDPYSPTPARRCPLSH